MKKYDKDKVLDSVIQVNNEMFRAMQDMTIPERIDYLAYLMSLVMRWNGSNYIKGTSHKMMEETKSFAQQFIDRLRDRDV